MATVTGLTKARMEQIERECIINGAVDLSGDLILTDRGGETLNAGRVRGIDGTNGTNGAVGPQGPKGDRGAPGYQLWAGFICPFAGAANVPTGWMICDGRELTRTSYSDLFAVIGTIYGPGNGTTTFNIPDLTNLTPIGGAMSATAPNGVGKKIGAATHKLLPNHLPPHVHKMDHEHPPTNTDPENENHQHSVRRATGTGSNANMVAQGNGTSAGSPTTTVQSNKHTHPVVTPKYVGDTQENVTTNDAFSLHQPSMYLLYCIKVLNNY